VIVFFRDKKRMDEFTSSPFYHKLGRQKKVLSEEMSASEKEFVISKAATCGQITISSAVFGRGTDFFCKDDRVQKNGGVHVVQAFLSEERSEEIQIQGRTARQGKKGSYQMVLLQSDLLDDFGIPIGTVGSIAKSDMYPFLCQARQKQREKYCQTVEQNLSEATSSDRRTHRYFDALLAGESRDSRRLLSDLYTSYKKKQMPQSIDVDLAFAVDVTGSMGPYAAAATDTLKSIIGPGSSSVASKLRATFPEIEFKVRISCMGCRDIDDKPMQFQESTWRNGGHFTEDTGEVVQFITKTLANPSGGGDIAEDHLGAINRCSTWQSPGDWESQIKFIMLITDAPAHGMVPPSCAAVPNADNYAKRHPAGLTPSTVVGNLIKRDIDLFFCSYNPAATRRTEEELAQQYLDHPENKEKREVTVIPMVPKGSEMSVVSSASGLPGSALIGEYGKHIIFVLDESGSMQHSWSGVIAAYNQYLHRRRQNQSDSDLVSVVQFDDKARATVSIEKISLAPASLDYRGGGTCFFPAALTASQLAAQTPTSHSPVVVFMSDGGTNDAAAAATVFATLNQGIRQRCNNDLELHVIGFGGGADTQQLQQIARASPSGKVYTSADTAELSSIFVNIAGGQDVGIILTAEVGKRISEAVADRLAVEYLR
jgi:Mg-chelatase subunit ChlD